MEVPLAIISIIIFILLLLFFMSVYTVKQQTYAVIERFGRFIKITDPGLHCKLPIVDRVAGRVSIRVRK